MDYVEKMLREKKKPGVLVDAVLSDSTTPGFYARRGWKLIPGSYSQYVYNLPENTDIKIFLNYQDRGNPLLERTAYRNKYRFDD